MGAWDSIKGALGWGGQNASELDEEELRQRLQAAYIAEKARGNPELDQKNLEIAINSAEWGKSNPDGNFRAKFAKPGTAVSAVTESQEPDLVRQPDFNG